MSDDPFPGSSADFYEQIQILKAEIARLKDENKITVSVCNENTDLKKLITELADALNLADCEGCDYSPLIQRARAATKTPEI